MDISLGGAGGSGDEHNAFNSQMGKKSGHRHTASQIQRLEAFYKDCPHPDENQRKELGAALGLEPKQIKFWFQNKRTQVKTLNERTDNNVLRAENERMQCENIAIKEALKGVNCPSCGSSAFGDEERQLALQNLLQENSYLRQEYEKASRLLTSYVGKPARPEMDMVAPSPTPLTLGSASASASESPKPEGTFLGGLGHVSISDDNTTFLTNQQDMGKSVMWETATSAMEELVKLLLVNEPLWIKSQSQAAPEEEDEQGAFFVLNHDSYERIIPRAQSRHYRSSNARVESSKASRIVKMSAMELVHMFLDSEKWVYIFPTIVTKAQTIKVVESGSPGSRTGALQLMYEEMHILTPMVPPRDFVFLRYCYQLDRATWVIADVSFDSSEGNHIAHSASWRLPSGCMIHELPDGSSKVTWVEHVEVDSKTVTHQLYRDVVYNNVAYGAERWVVALQRMCERIACSLTDNIPSDEARGVASLPEGRKSLMRVSHRMMKDLCGAINMSFPHLSEVNENGVKLSFRKNFQRGQPGGMAVCAATSLWLPLPPHHVFDFLKDETRRDQWDILSNGSPAQEIGRISTGTHPGNYIAIFKPYIPTENHVLILQETCVEPMGYVVAYAPVNTSAMNEVTNGGESSGVPVVPSGFVVTGDGLRHPVSASGGENSGGRGGGSILTVAFQVLACSPAAVSRFNMESVSSVNSLIDTTLQKIKLALNC